MACTGNKLIISFVLAALIATAAAVTSDNETCRCGYQEQKQMNSTIVVIKETAFNCNEMIECQNVCEGLNKTERARQATCENEAFAGRSNITVKLMYAICNPQNMMTAMPAVPFNINCSDVVANSSNSASQSSTTSSDDSSSSSTSTTASSRSPASKNSKIVSSTEAEPTDAVTTVPTLTTKTTTSSTRTPTSTARPTTSSVTVSTSTTTRATAAASATTASSKFPIPSASQLGNSTATNGTSTTTVMTTTPRAPTNSTTTKKPSGAMRHDASGVLAVVCSVLLSVGLVRL